MKLLHTFGENAGKIEEFADPALAQRMLVINHARVPTAEDLANAESVAAVEDAPKRKRRKRSKAD